MEERTQSVGNAKIRGEFDMDAAMSVDPNTNQKCLVFAFSRVKSCPLDATRLCRYSLSGSHSFSWPEEIEVSDYANVVPHCAVIKT